MCFDEEWTICALRSVWKVGCVRHSRGAKARKATRAKPPGFGERKWGVGGRRGMVESEPRRGLYTPPLPSPSAVPSSRGCRLWPYRETHLPFSDARAYTGRAQTFRKTPRGRDLMLYMYMQYLRSTKGESSLLSGMVRSLSQFLRARRVHIRCADIRVVHLRRIFGQEASFDSLEIRPGKYT